MQALKTTQRLPIGTVARRTGLAVSAIRYYEEVGLVPPGDRSEGGHRVYPDAVVDLLTMVRHCRDLGFSIEDTRTLLSLAGDAERDCQEARDIANAHLIAVRTKLAELRHFERSLTRFVQDCDEKCAGGSAVKCCIFEDLRKGQTKPKASCC